MRSMFSSTPRVTRSVIFGDKIRGDGACKPQASLDSETAESGREPSDARRAAPRKRRVDTRSIADKGLAGIGDGDGGRWVSTE
eukprot:CAMPEP_0115655130 /NCGR_PEP_ID=MMETSP0272-20121206/43470_1 /TAXON_ID=71861 /ORGANISM="Scrippsiella trochoidea, Strain CCMP3099" /LENGTH=82 /DNA_ID=CAMNT_0003093045 /DNA_START=49 /DNA_END=294 /DNA_ORIENTATION=+